jgi:antitoxin CptB
MTKTMTTIQKKLIYSSWHRGVREADLILGRFADLYVPDFSPPQIEQYEAILNLPDSDILSWIYKQQPVPANVDKDIMQKIIAFANRE